MTISENQSMSVHPLMQALESVANMKEDARLAGKHVRLYVEGDQYKVGAFSKIELIIDLILQVLESLGGKLSKGIAGEGKITLANKLATDLSNNASSNALLDSDRNILKACREIAEKSPQLKDIFTAVAELLEPRSTDSDDSGNVSESSDPETVADYSSIQGQQNPAEVDSLPTIDSKEIKHLNSSTYLKNQINFFSRKIDALSQITSLRLEVSKNTAALTALLESVLKTTKSHWKDAETFRKQEASVKTCDKKIADLRELVTDQVKKLAILEHEYPGGVENTESMETLEALKENHLILLDVLIKKRLNNLTWIRNNAYFDTEQNKKTTVGHAVLVHMTKQTPFSESLKIQLLEQPQGISG